MKKIIYIVTIVVLSALILSAVFILFSCVYGKNQMYIAIKNNDIQMVEEIISSDPSSASRYMKRSRLDRALSETTDYYPLDLACSVGNIEIVEILLAAGADVNSINPQSGYSPLWYALHSEGDNDYEIAFLLIDNNADIDYVANEYAVFINSIISCPAYTSDQDFSQQMEMFDYLLSNCNLSLIDLQQTLSYACKFDNIYAAEKLLNGYVDIDDTDSSGETALMCAAREDSRNAVRFLLDRGANTELRNSKGQTAYDIAIEKQHDEIAKMLLN